MESERFRPSSTWADSELMCGWPVGVGNIDLNDSITVACDTEDKLVKCCGLWAVSVMRDLVHGKVSCPCMEISNLVGGYYKWEYKLMLLYSRTYLFVKYDADWCRSSFGLGTMSMYFYLQVKGVFKLAGKRDTRFWGYSRGHTSDSLGAERDWHWLEAKFTGLNLSGFRRPLENEP